MDLDEEKGKRHNNWGYLDFMVQETLFTGPGTALELEDTDIENQITKRMRKFMDNSRSFKHQAIN